MANTLYLDEAGAKLLVELLKQYADNSSATATNNLMNILLGDGENSIEDKINKAFDEFGKEISDDKVINTYKELIDWANEHGSEAAEIIGKITELEKHMHDTVYISNEQIDSLFAE